MFQINSTHNPSLTSWVASANDGATDFPIQNLPYGVFQRADERARIGVGIGNQILDLSYCVSQGVFDSTEEQTRTALLGETLNDLMNLSLRQRSLLREIISERLSASAKSDDRKILQQGLVDQSRVQLLLPSQIRNYTDFYASIYHATNVGIMLRPNNPLLPNYKHIPIGYHGRASSVVVSGTDVRRPRGQIGPAEESGQPTWDISRTLDYELELGCFVGRGNRLGEPININDAEDHLFGICLLNDWSARDIQKWEYQPLGPFLAKSFATSISPWVVTMEALTPFRCREFSRPAGDPAPLPYLDADQNSNLGGIDLNLEVWLRSASMREKGMAAVQLSRGKFTGMYWTFAQMLTHHSSNGCNLQAGDLLGSGTISGQPKESRGCMLELTWDGDLNNPLPGSARTGFKLPTGEERKFLADGDEVIFKGYCETDNYRRIGLGSCTGTVLPAI